MIYRELYEDRLERIRALLHDDEVDEASVAESRRLRREVRKVQREKLIRLYRKGKISAETWRAVNRRVDLEDPDIRRGVG
jgi:CPA1 family monovalent cation:H+ antiporter